MTYKKQIPMNRKLLLILLFTALLSALASSQRLPMTTPYLLRDHVVSMRAQAFADSILRIMTIEEKVAQLIMPMVYPRSSSTDVAAWDQMVKEKKYGGVLWQKGDPQTVVQLTNRMRQSVPAVPMLVAMDGEWGLSMRFSGTTDWPCNIVIGATDDTLLAYEYGRATALEAKRLGIHVNFAPVIDVNSNPRNPVIGTRSYGSNSDRVTALGIAYARGMEEHGVLATAKHFPGHGDTDTDSHKTLPVISKSLDQLEQTELRPFRAFIDAGLGGMMIAHLQIPALGTGSRASSASRSVVTDLLQTQMRFGGLIFTDGLGMKGILSGTGGQSVAVEVFRAGADILLAPDNPDQALSDLMKALKAKIISPDEVHQRVRKILIWKYVLNVGDRTPLSSQGLDSDLHSPESCLLLSKLYSASITLLKNHKALLPLKAQRRIALVRYGNTQLSTLASVLKGVDSYAITPGANHSQIYAKLKDYDAIIIAVSSATAQPESALIQLCRQVPTVVTFLTSPYTLTRFTNLIKGARAVVLAYDTKPEAQRALANALMGETPFTGKLPVDLSPLFREGTGLSADNHSTLPVAEPEAVGLSSTRLQKIDQIVESGLRYGAYPGCQVLVAKDGKVVFHKAYGFKDAKRTEPNNTQTLYDLASVTKAIATVPLVMIAKDEKKLSERDYLAQHLSYLSGSDKARIPLSHLLYHVAGLPAIIRFYTFLIAPDSYPPPLLSFSPRSGFPIQIAGDAWARKGFRYRRDLVSSDSSALYPERFAHGQYLSPAVRDTMRIHIRDAELRPSRYRYSDVDFLLVQDVLESVYGQSLDQLFAQKIAQPLGASRLLFKPYTHFPSTEIAEGQNDAFLRWQTLRGDVDDEAAAMLGGVSGNAGLFGNAEDVARVLLMLDDMGKYDGQQVIQSSTVRHFTTARHSTSPYALGFNRLARNGKPSPKVPKAALSTYGHTGFTGTCFWIDPTHHIVYVFLSNRVAPTRWNNRLSAMDIRNKVLSAVYDAML